MKEIKKLYLDLEDLGKEVFIDKINFSQVNDFGICAYLDMKFSNNKRFEQFGLRNKTATIVFDIETFDDDTVGILFAVQEFVNDDNSFGTLIIYHDTVQESPNGYLDEPVQNVYFDESLLRTLEAYVTVQFHEKLGISMYLSPFQERNRDSLTSDEDLLYVRQYLIVKNANAFSLLDSNMIKGENINYPTR